MAFAILGVTACNKDHSDDPQPVNIEKNVDKAITAVDSTDHIPVVVDSISTNATTTVMVSPEIPAYLTPELPTQKTPKPIFGNEIPNKLVGPSKSQSTPSPLEAPLLLPKSVGNSTPIAHPSPLVTPPSSGNMVPVVSQKVVEGVQSGFSGTNKGPVIESTYGIHGGQSHGVQVVPVRTVQMTPRPVMVTPPHTKQVVPLAIPPHTKQVVPLAIPPHTKQVVPLAIPPHTKQVVPLVTPPHTKQVVPLAIPPHTKQVVPLATPPHTKQVVPLATPPHTEQMVPPLRHKAPYQSPQAMVEPQNTTQSIPMATPTKIEQKNPTLPSQTGRLKSGTQEFTDAYMLQSYHQDVKGVISKGGKKIIEQSTLTPAHFNTNAYLKQSYKEDVHSLKKHPKGSKGAIN
ncbi:hypothetical protein PEPS_31400 (plasmid) [Persicobacter psychrovividus]|uniref:Uncharacterized protein n=2 Tax=Persicobacter psychrovividus TaxID=387638 RepID=A0ABM7VIR5_9BACT|nr:hypothetical protein PEPS_31400 [Persicobacter psychrovividus]